MSEERLNRIEAMIDGLNQSINLLVTEFIRPNTQQTYANFERLERLESALENLVAQSLINAEQIEANQRQIEANQRQIAGNAESITRLEVKVDQVAETVSEQSQQIQVLIEEGRADRQAQREAFASILSINSRVEALEQKAS